MPLPETGYDLATVTNPSSALTDFVLLVDLSLMSATFKSNWNTDANGYGRAAIDGGPTELACDWIDLDYSAGTGLLRVKWTGTLASSGTQKLRIYPPNTDNAQYAHDDTYGSDNAYPDTILGYYPDGGTEDRSSSENDGTAYGSPSEGGAAGPTGGATQFNGSTQYIQYPWDIDSEGEISILLAYRPEEITAEDPIFCRYSAAGYWQFLAGFGANYTRDTSTGATGARNNDISWTPKSTGSWYSYAAVYTVIGGSKKVRIDGSDMAASSTSIDAMNSLNANNCLAACKEDGGLGDMGALYAQHVWFFLEALSNAWIDEEDSQVGDNATFWGSWVWQSGEPPSGVVRFGGLCGKALSGSLGGRGI
jgi:hypothetical protein